MRDFVAGLGFAAAATLFPAAAAADMTFGVIAIRGEAAATTQWSALADHLSEALGETVTLRPLGTQALLDAYRGGELDAMLTNPVMSAITEREGGTLIASLEKKSGKELAGVIVANRKAGVASVADLKGKKLITPPTASAGAFICPSALALEHGVSIPADMSVHKIGNNQVDMIRLVEKGVFDVAFVRSGMVEAAIEAGVDPANIVIVNEQATPGFKPRHSTRLYPEWYVVGRPGLSDEDAARLQAALVAMAPDSEAMTAARVVGFHPPLDIAPIVEALTIVGMAPFGS